jgi:hypothetical protein
VWMFLGWYDPDRKKPARQKLAEAIERYVEKFGAAPELCLTNPADKADLDIATKAFPEAPTVPVETAPYIPRWTFYVGVRDEEPADLAA